MTLTTIKTLAQVEQRFRRDELERTEISTELRLLRERLNSLQTVFPDGGAAPIPHPALTLDATADVFLSLNSGLQVLGADQQGANEVFAGPVAAPDAFPDFRALVFDDIPSTSNAITNPSTILAGDANGDITLRRLTLGDRLIHDGDPDTYLEFTPDLITLNVGSELLLSLLEGAQNEVVINDGGASDVDFRAEGGGSPWALFMRGSDGNVGISQGSPAAKLDVLATTTQFRLTHTDGSVFADMTVDASHDLTIAPSSTGQILLDSNVTVTSGHDLVVPGLISHLGDLDTSISFATDQISFLAGGEIMLSLIESAQDEVVVNQISQDIDFRVEGATDTHLIFAEAGTDRVGIGTSNPATELDVNGDITVAGSLIHGGDTDTRITFADDVQTYTVGGLIMLRLTEVAGQDFLEIGDVAGAGDVDINFNNGQVFIQGSSGFLGIGETSPATELDVNGHITVAGSIFHKGDTDTLIIFSTDSIRFVAGNTTMLTLTETTQDEVVVNDGSDDVDFRVEGSGTETHLFFVDAGAELVGILTDTPGFELDINGSLGVSEFIVHSGDLDTHIGFTPDVQVFTAGGVEMLTLTETTQDVVSIGDVGGAGDVDVNFSDGQMFLRGSDGFLGIGITSPATELDVNGSLTLSGGTQSQLIFGSGNELAIQGQTTGVGSFVSLHSNDGDGTDNVALSVFGVGTPGATANRERVVLRYAVGAIAMELLSEAQGTGTLRPLILYTEGNAYQLYLETDGNVGVGTNSPQVRLHVQDSVDEIVRITHSSITGSPKLSLSQTTTIRSYLQHVDTGDDFRIASEYGKITFWTHNAGTEVQRMEISDLGHVGIGVAATLNLQLHIRGGSNEVLRVETSSATGSPHITLYQSGTKRAQLQFLDVGNSFVIFNQYGNTSIGAGTGGSATQRLHVVSGGMVGINTTVNSKMTLGLTIDQDQNDGEVLALQSTGDVDHGMTNEVDTQTFAAFQKRSAPQGGLIIRAFSEATLGMQLQGNVVTDITAKTTSASAAVEIRAAKKSDSTVGNMGAGANLLAIRNHLTTRWILDAEGDIFYGGSDDGAITDKYDDAPLLAGFRAIMSPKESPAHRRFKGFLRETEDILVQQGVLTARLDEGGLVSDTALKGLIIDALIQITNRLNTLEEKHAS